MKAKHFKKLRKKLQWYDVQITRGLFGDFPWNWEYPSSFLWVLENLLFIKLKREKNDTTL